jgi:hypothetical protein
VCSVEVMLELREATEGVSEPWDACCLWLRRVAPLTARSLRLPPSVCIVTPYIKA